VCDVFNAPVKCPSSCDASFGSALLAGVGVGIFKDETAAVKQCLKLDCEIIPRPKRALFYAEQFKFYKDIHDSLAGCYREINGKE
jgi:xylulokinase